MKKKNSVFNVIKNYQIFNSTIKNIISG